VDRPCTAQETREPDRVLEAEHETIERHRIAQQDAAAGPRAEPEALTPRVEQQRRRAPGQPDPFVAQRDAAAP